MNDYQQNILENYKNPDNFGEPDFIPNATATENNITCGDKIEVFLKIENNIISNVSFKAEGCSIAIGSFSILTNELRGMSKDEVIELDYESFIKPKIGLELTPTRIKCAKLGLDAVKQALSNL